MGEPYHAVLLKPEAKLDLPLAGAMLAVLTSRPRADAIHLLHDCGGILADDLTEEQARVLTAGLTAKGMPAVYARTDTLRPLPPAQPINEAQVQPEALWVRQTGQQAEVALEEVPWDALRLVTAARVRVNEVVTRVAPVLQVSTRHYPDGARGNIIAAAPQRQEVVRAAWTYVADVLAADPWRRYRLAADHFHHGSTTLPVQPTSFANFAQLVGAITGHAEQAVIDGSVRLLLDGNPQTNLDAHSLDHYDRYIRWRIQFLPRIGR